ncbi:hypothetical protein [uncultured Deinococcus sp.]|uniref:hypothetical protein n=1 Tax=uncultured Deinococcus sp. TaxID=158789 RepID=UPI0037480508
MTQPPELDEATRARIRAEEAYRAELRRPRMDQGAVLCLVGAALLAAGTFLPAVSVAALSVSLLGAGNGDGLVLLVLAALSAVFVPLARPWVLFSALLAAGFLVYKLITLMAAMSGSAFSQLGWAWAPMFLGVGLMLWGCLTPPTQKPMH